MVALKETNEFLLKKLNNYLLQNLNFNREISKLKKRNKITKLPLEETNVYSIEEKTINNSSRNENVANSNHSLPEYLEQKLDNNNFQKTLFYFIDKTNKKDSDIYNKAFIDRRLFSKIRSDKNYHPSKETVILLAIALELNEKELDDLLESASYSLPKNNKYDLIIRFCFINKIFKLTDINELLYEYNCKLLSY